MQKAINNYVKLLDRKDYEINSDILLRSVSSSAAAASAAAAAAGAITVPYDTSSLKNLTNISPELLSLAPLPEIADDDQEDTETTNNIASLDRDAKSGKTKSEFILAMIFKIVPIGVNIAKKGKTIATGFKRLSMGIVNLLKNAALLSAIVFMDTITFAVQLCVYLFKLLLCTVIIIGNFPKCVVFYVINLFMLFVLSCIISILFMFDVFFMVKYFLGTSCIEMFMMLLEFLEMIDQFLYSTFSFHIIHYPETVLNRCYRCSVMGDTSGFRASLSRVFNDIFVKIPNDIGGPIGESLTGIGNILSFLDLS